MICEIFVITHVLEAAGIDTKGGIEQFMKILKLIRIFRMGRLALFFPDLVGMLKGLVAAIRPVGSMMFMLFILLYVFSILIFLLVRHDHDMDPNFKKNYFESLAQTMWTLLLDGVFMDSLALIARHFVTTDGIRAVLALV